MATKRRKPLFERLRAGLEVGIAHARAAMSQAVFARMLNVSTKTLQSWEQGVRPPSDASRRLIQVFSSHPEVVCRSAGLPEIRLEGVAVEPLSQGGRRIVVKPVGRKTWQSGNVRRRGSGSHSPRARE